MLHAPFLVEHPTGKVIVNQPCDSFFFPKPLIDCRCLKGPWAWLAQRGRLWDLQAPACGPNGWHTVVTDAAAVQP